LRPSSASTSKSFHSLEGREVDARLRISCGITSLDQLVCAQQQRFGDLSPKFLGGLLIDENSNLTGRQQRAQQLRAGSYDEIQIGSSKIGSNLLHAFDIALGKTIVDRDILPLDEAILDQAGHVLLTTEKIRR